MFLRSQCSLLLLMAGLAGCASAPVTPPVPSPTLFAFHVSSWVNLHQQLYFEAHPPPGFTPERPEEERWTPAERQAWDAAVASYREHTPEGALAPLYDPVLIATRQALEDVPEEAALAGVPKLPPELASLY